MTRAFERVFELQIQNYTSPEHLRQVHIKTAKEIFKRYTSDKQTGYIIETDGHPSFSEDSVQPFGVIKYIFQHLPDVGRYALVTARNISPVGTISNSSRRIQRPGHPGLYRKSWIILADRVEVSENSIPPGVKELIVTNFSDYARKTERRGARIVGVPPGIVERVRQMTLRQYSSVARIGIQYITLSNGYQLSNPIVRRGIEEHQLTYPSLVIQAKF